MLPREKRLSKPIMQIQEALRKGGRLHAFLSGGGLRVIRIERKGKLVAYGEHPYVEEALVHTGEDYAAGGRPYGKVYGEKGLYPHYLTGDPNPTTPLDQWVRGGHTFDAWYDDGQYVVSLKGMQEARTPEETVKKVTSRQVAREVWTDERGVTFECTPSRFPNGELCCSTRIVSKPDGMKDHRAWMWYATRTARANTLMEALDAAPNQPFVEINED